MSQASNAASPAAARTRLMLHGPLLPTLLRLATPNVVGLFAMTVVIGYDGYIIGRLGGEALAGVALVFPLSMLMMQMSGGGIGGAGHCGRGPRPGRRAVDAWRSSASGFFGAAAASLAAYGLTIAAAIKVGSWTR